MRKEKRTVKFISCALACAALATGSIESASAANWFKLEGISPPKAPLVHLSGFIIPLYKYMNGTTAVNGQVPKINLVAPQDTSSKSFNILFAHIMLRGNINKHISYMMAGEFGNNQFTHVGGNYTPQLMDAHATFSYIPGARIEAGIIRAPGAEEAMQGYPNFAFGFNYTTVTQQLILQPFYSATNTSNPYKPGGTPGSYSVPGTSVLGNNAFRYPGAEVMDWFHAGNMEYAYGVMVGNFGRLTGTNTSNGPLVAARLQASYLLKGFGPDHGPFRSDVTGFLWYQHANPIFNGQSNSMTRDGLGITYTQGYMHRWGRWAKFEYMRGSGMIDAPAVFNTYLAAPPTLTDAQIYPGSQNKASGYYVSGGLFVTNRLELDLRYDVYDRLPNIAPQERIFKTWAIGGQYHITKFTRVMVDYFVRSVNIPHLSSIPPSPAKSIAQSVAGAADNEIAITAFVAF